MSYALTKWFPDMCQRYISKSASEAVESKKGLCHIYVDILYIIQSFCKRTGKPLIKLRRCIDWSGHCFVCLFEVGFNTTVMSLSCLAVTMRNDVILLCVVSFKYHARGTITWNCVDMVSFLPHPSRQSLNFRNRSRDYFLWWKKKFSLEWYFTLSANSFPQPVSSFGNDPMSEYTPLCRWFLPNLNMWTRKLSN